MDEDQAAAERETTPDQAAAVLHHYGHGGFPGSPAERLLLRALSEATPRERQLIAAGFPGLVAADTWGHHGHWAALDRRARGR